MVHAGTTAERLAIIGRFGDILSLHENHFNAPEGATFTNAIYTPSGMMVDWIFVPRAGARRPAASRLLIDKVGLATASTSLPSAVDELADQLSERVAFFWMLIFPTIKSLLRGDLVRFHSELDVTTKVRLDVEQLLAGGRPTYRRDAVTTLLPTNAERIAAIREEVHRMERLAPAVRAAGSIAPQDPRAGVESMLSVAVGEQR